MFKVGDKIRLKNRDITGVITYASSIYVCYRPTGENCVLVCPAFQLELDCDNKIIIMNPRLKKNLT